MTGWVRSSVSALAHIPAWAAGAALSALWFLPVLSSSFAGSDHYLAHASVIAQYDRTTNAAVFGQLVAHYRAHHAGSFPLQPDVFAVWLLDSHFRLAKDLQYLLIVGCFSCFASCARYAFGTTPGAIAAVCASLCAWQFRLHDDPVVGTSLLTTTPAFLTLACYAAFFRYRANGAAVPLALACAAGLLASATGWIELLLVAALWLWASFERPIRLGAALLAACTAVACIAAGVTGSLAASIALSGPAQIATQLAAAIPASFRVSHLVAGHVPALWHMTPRGWRYADDRFIGIPQITPQGWAACYALAAAAFVALSSWRDRAAVQTSALALTAGAFWGVPALFGARDAAGPLVFGQATASVIYEYFGFGLAAAGTYAFTMGRNLTLDRVLPAAAALAVLAIGYGNVRADAWVLAINAHTDAARASLERAASGGLFAQLPTGATIAVDPAVPFADGIHDSVSDARYAIFHYSGRRFSVGSLAAAAPARDAWALLYGNGLGVYVTLARIAGRDRSGILTDHAFGFTPFSSIAKQVAAESPGLAVSTAKAASGIVLDVRRTCGAVPIAHAYARNRPSIAFIRGFYAQGPVGYSQIRPQINLIGDVAGYPLMFMGPHAALSLSRPACKGDVSNFHAVVTALAHGRLVVTAQGVPQTYAVSQAPSDIWLALDDPSGSGIVTFDTSAPTGELDPIEFRYVLDRPRDLRLLFTATGAWEEPRR